MREGVTGEAARGQASERNVSGGWWFRRGREAHLVRLGRDLRETRAAFVTLVLPPGRLPAGLWDSWAAAWLRERGWERWPTC